MTRRIELTDRDRQLLAHVARYRVTRAKTVARLFFGQTDLNAAPAERAKSRLKKLVRHEFLAAEELYRGAPRHGKYYLLTRKSARLIGESPDLAKKPGHQALLRRLGVLSYCCHSTPAHTRLSRSELAELFPGLVPNANSPINDYFVDRAGEGDRFALVRIIIDGGKEVRRHTSRMASIIRQEQSRPDLRPLFGDSAYELAFVAPDREKARAVRDAHLAHPLTKTIPLRLAVLPELVQLLANRQNQR